MHPLAPNSTVWAGMPDESMISWHASTRRRLRAIVASTADREHASVRVALTAAMTSGLPL